MHSRHAVEYLVSRVLLGHFAASPGPSAEVPWVLYSDQGPFSPSLSKTDLFFDLG